jgi:hypothetical protein
MYKKDERTKLRIGDINYIPANSIQYIRYLMSSSWFEVYKATNVKYAGIRQQVKLTTIPVAFDVRATIMTKVINAIKKELGLTPKYFLIKNRF